jgi:hypothetical protein
VRAGRHPMIFDLMTAVDAADEPEELKEPPPN